MKVLYGLCAPALFATLVLVGCKDAAHEKGKASATDRAGGSDESAEAKGQEAEIQANLAKLGPEDRKLAEEQRFCAVETTNRLGSMGAPFKLLVKDQPVFLCCKGCQRRALADPDKTLARVSELKAKVVGSSEK